MAVPDGAGTDLEQLVLIDGYRRVAALRHLGRDTASVEQWGCDLTEALLGLLARTQNRADNVLFIGKPGTGKTGLAMGLLREACLNGYRGRFYNAQVLLDELYASLADRTTTRLLAQMSRMRPLAIDELGYLTLKPEQANAFFRLMDQRYNRVTTIITTNLELPDWYDLFDKKSLVDALLDHLQHHCITIRIDGPSLRNPEPAASKSPRRAAKANPPMTVAS